MRGAVAVLLMCWTAVVASAKPPKKPLPSPGVLADTHGKLACDQCHDKLRSRVLRAKCFGCHALEKRIAAQSGLHGSSAFATKRCESCHHDHRGKTADISGWAGLRFDHQLAWPVKHAMPACARCHTGAYRELAKLETPDGAVACLGCHAASHDKQYGEERCGDCHHLELSIDELDAVTARATAHADDGAFPLAKGHALKCETCHRVTRAGKRVSIFNAIDPQCTSCHGDVHRGANGATCDRCHRGGSWDDVEAPRPGTCSRCHKLFGAAR